VELKQVDINLIQFGERARKEYGNIPDMIQSIKEHGLIHPLAVRPGENGTYLLVAGGRRLTALKQIPDFGPVPIRIYSRDLSPQEIKKIERAENIDRLDMTWSEKIKLEKEIHDLQVETAPPGERWERKDTAEMLGVSASKITQDLQLAEAVEEIPELKDCKTKDEAAKKLSILKEKLLKEELSKRLSEKSRQEGNEIKKTLIDAYRIGDFFECSHKEIPSNTFQLVELDPPYAIEMDTAKANWSYVEYKEMHRKDYLAHMSHVLEEAYRVLTDHGWLVFWHAMDPWGEELYTLMTTMGFRGPRTPAIWTKPGITGKTSRPDTILGSNYETFYYATKRDGVIIKQGRQNVFNFPVVDQVKKVHPTERPIELITEVISTFTVMGSRIFVPFLGSGNSILAAANINSYATGYEISPEFKEDYIIKVNESSENKFTSYGRF
jgi:ParB/RepB/Spo0J family partition protein